MSGAYSTTYRYDEPAVRGGRVRSGYPDGMSPKVRVRYFDPATGEPCDEKPVPPKRAKRRTEDKAMLKASIARARAKTIERRGQPVIGDGVEHPGVNSAAKAVGCAGSTLANKLRDGATEYRGHAIRFKDPRHARA